MSFRELHLNSALSSKTAIKGPIVSDFAVAVSLITVHGQGRLKKGAQNRERGKTEVLGAEPFYSPTSPSVITFTSHQQRNGSHLPF